MHSAFIQPLLAADLTHVAIWLIVVFVAAMKQLFDASKEANKKKAAALAAGQQKPPVPQKPVAAGAQADPLRAQVEEFLRRAGGQPQTNQAPPPTPQPPRARPIREIEMLVGDDNRSAERQPLGGLSQPAAARVSPAAAAANAAKAADQRRVARRPRRLQTVAEHVAERVSSRSQVISEQAENLGQRIVKDDQQFDSQLKARFDHTVGSLATTSTSDQPALPAADSPARQIAAMLANPDGVRQAVIINEILRRPSDRW